MIYINSKVRVKITGKNIDRFINRLIKNGFTLFDLKQISRKSLIILIPYVELEKLDKIKTVYDIEVLDYKGAKEIKNKLIKNKYIIISLIIGFIIFRILTSLIFDVEVIHNDSNLRNLVLEELEQNGIKKLSFKKSYKSINEIKENILTKYKDNIEWIEIEENGTKYTVRLEERIDNNIIPDNKIQDIVSSSDALILSVEADSGEILRNINDYVHKGDVIISHNISFNGEVKNTVKAVGKVYGEVWYNVSVSYPFHYRKEIKTEEKKKVLSFYFFDKKIELFNFNKYKNKSVKENTILKNNIFPIKLTLETQTKVEVIDEINTKEEALKKAEEKAKNQINEGLSGEEHIIDIKKLKVSENESKIIVDYFVSVYKDITEVKEILE